MIRSVESDDDYARLIALREAIDPLTATTVADVRAFRRQAESSLYVLAAELDGIAWLERRGFQLFDRQERVVLDLSNGAGVQTIHPFELSDLAHRRDLAPALYRLLVEGVSDVPGALAEEVPSFKAWLDYQQVPSRKPEFLVTALEHGEPVAYSQLHVYPRVGYHGFTTVARHARGRGLARAVKLELIRRARDAGLERLITQSNEANAAMRTLNESLGYRAAPASLTFAGLIV